MAMERVYPKGVCKQHHEASNKMEPTRKIGRPKITFTRDIESDMKTWNYIWHQLERAASDRSRWRT